MTVTKSSPKACFNGSNPGGRVYIEERNGLRPQWSSGKVLWLNLRSEPMIQAAFKSCQKIALLRLEHVSNNGWRNSSSDIYRLMPSWKCISFESQKFNSCIIPVRCISTRGLFPSRHYAVFLAMKRQGCTILTSTPISNNMAPIIWETALGSSAAPIFWLMCRIVVFLKVTHSCVKWYSFAANESESIIAFERAASLKPSWNSRWNFWCAVVSAKLHTGSKAWDAVSEVC